MKNRIAQESDGKANRKKKSGEIEAKNAGKTNTLRGNLWPVGKRNGSITGGMNESQLY